MEREMSVKRLLEMTSGVKADPAENAASKKARTSAGLLYGDVKRLEDAENRADVAEARVKELLAAGVNSREIPLADLHEAPGRKRTLTEEQFTELVENLRSNPLVTPITVRVRAEGGFEIISGHNRVAAFRALERETIPAVVADTDQEQADVNAFYANLLQPDLTDYEKYLGFKMLKSKYPDMTDTEIASKAGKSKSFVSQIKCFDELPPSALAVIAGNPSIVGANTAQMFAGLVKKGRDQQVIEAVVQLANGAVDQAQAVKIASTDPAPKAPKRSEPTRYKLGKATYCDFRRADKVLRIDFVSAEEAEAVESAIKAVLEQRIVKLKGGA
jgi:ParB family chromosome partitioning protein